VAAESRLRHWRDMPDPNSVPLVHCSNCQALYQVVKAQAGPETVDLEIACQVCKGPLTARQGQFVLKYFLLREASRLDVRRARQGSLRAKPTARRKKASVSNMKKPGREAGAVCSEERAGEAAPPSRGPKRAATPRRRPPVRAGRRRVVAHTTSRSISPMRSFVIRPRMVRTGVLHSVSIARFFVIGFFLALLPFDRLLINGRRVEDGAKSLIGGLQFGRQPNTSLAEL
jgi:hypothetical protein